MVYYAHSKSTAGQRHDLVQHLVSVAERAREFAAPFGGGKAANRKAAAVRNTH